MSVGFLLESKDDAVIWRGPKKNGDLHKVFYFLITLKNITTRLLYFHKYYYSSYDQTIFD